MTSGALGKKLGLSFLWQYRLVLLCLAAKLSHMGDDMEGLACHLH
jgi:hypothetical protein